MNIYYSTAKNHFIFDQSLGMPVGRVYDFAWDEKDGGLKIILLKKILFDRKEKILVPEDIIDWNNEGLYIATFENISLAKEIVRFSRIFETYYTLIDIPVYDVNDDYVGKVSDYIFDGEIGQLVSIIIAGKQKRIISFSQIELLSEDKIVIKNNYVEVSFQEATAVI